MKKNNLALSNEVYENDLYVCKKYISNEFKRAIGNNDFKIQALNKIYPISIANEMFCYERIQHTTFKSENISFELIDEVIKSLKKFHTLKPTNVTKVNFKKAWNVIKPFYEVTIEKQKIINNAFKLLKNNIVLLHNDVVDGNILILENNKIKLIDFEYSGYGNEMFDVASFLTERVIEKKYKDYFLKKYYSKRKYDEDELKTIIKFSIIFWSAWALYMYSIHKKNIYKQIHSWKEKDYLNY